MALQLNILGTSFQFQPLDNIGVTTKLAMLAMHSDIFFHATSKKIMVQRYIKMSLIFNPPFTA